MVAGEDAQSLFLGNLLPLEGDGLLGELLHLRFDRGEVFFGDDPVPEVHVVIEALFDGGAKAEQASGI